MGQKRNLVLMLAFLFLAFAATGEEGQGDYLNPSDSAADNAALQDIRDTMGQEILFNPQQDGKTGSTPVLIISKNIPVAAAGHNPSQPKARLLNPLNRWHLDLKDSADRSVELQMTQSNDAVFGRGVVAAAGFAQDATATGKVAGKKLSLDILTADLTLFRLDLTLNGKSIAGDYHAYSTAYMPWKGIAMGAIY